MIAIIDYGMGNVRSVCNALEYVGAECVITSNSRQIRDCSSIILPGVGAFRKAMANLEQLDLINILHNEVIKKGKHFLGICLGLQLLAKYGNEYGSQPGLGWIDAEVRRFDLDERRYRLPHVGWNEIVVMKNHDIFNNMMQIELNFYFDHSYYLDCDNEDIVAAKCNYGREFTAAIVKDNILATQFHPEKSQDNGLELLMNFAQWSE